MIGEDDILDDIKLAKKTLLNGEYTLVAVKDGKIIYRSTDKGIKPMFIFTRDLKRVAKNASVADRVIGEGAALLCSDLGLKEVYAGLISEGGMEVFDSKGINYSYDKSCEYIKNRDGSDYCPVEKISMDVKNKSQLVERLEVFLQNTQGGRD